MQVKDALLLIMALITALALLSWLAMEHLILKRQWQVTETERRSLDYRVMLLTTRWESERQELQQALMRVRSKRAAERDEAAKQLRALKADLTEALEIALAYRQMGGAAPDSVLAKLRDDLSEFGHLMEQDPCA
jgi:hypothetical protein